jgi:hypothetical protein
MGCPPADEGCNVRKPGAQEAASGPEAGDRVRGVDVYTNADTGFRVSLATLSDEERAFYLEAVKRFKLGVPWVEFDEFAFGLRSPIFSKRRSHGDVLKHPLFLALKDMSIRLGISQGLIARKSPTAAG